MGYIPPDVVKKVKEIDLLTYLRMCNPNELVKDSSNQYSTKTHNSLKISNGYWNYFNGGIGGKNAVDYVEKILGYSFPNSIEYILKQLGNDRVLIQEETKKIVKENKKKTYKCLKLPPRNNNNDIAIKYLKSRGIDEKIIKKCIEDNIIYEEKYHHSVVFIGYDEIGKPKYAGYRATNGETIKKDLTGSDKGFPFKIQTKDNNETLYIFEGAIDLLSFITFMKMNNIKWENNTYISLAGVSQTNKIIETKSIPESIKRTLNNNKNIKEIVLCLDNDEAGIKASCAIKTVLSDSYNVIEKPPKKGKDYNEYLCEYLKENEKNKRIERIR